MLLQQLKRVMASRPQTAKRQPQPYHPKPRPELEPRASSSLKNVIVEERIEGEYLFKFQFFVHEVSLLKDFYNISKPAIAIRFLDFPTLILEGKYRSLPSVIN